MRSDGNRTWGRESARLWEIDMRLSGDRVMAKPRRLVHSPDPGDAHIAWNRYVAMLQTHARR